MARIENQTDLVYETQIDLEGYIHSVYVIADSEEEAREVVHDHFEGKATIVSMSALRHELELIRKRIEEESKCQEQDTDIK